jgi:hypothetical protein
MTDPWGERRPWNDGHSRRFSVAGATAAAAAATASAKPARGARGTVRTSSGEHGELNRRFFAGTFRAGNFLLLVNHNFLEALVTAIADVFINRHELILDTSEVTLKL